jgi:hypothetical protein
MVSSTQDRIQWQVPVVVIMSFRLHVIFGLAEQLWASQEGLCSIELDVSYFQFHCLYCQQLHNKILSNIHLISPYIDEIIGWVSM